MFGKVKDDFFPHGSPEGVFEVVDFIHDHEGKVVEVASLVEHVAQHFGGHHHNVGIGIDGVVAGQQPDS